MNCERRSDAREGVVLPVSLHGGTAGFTRDISANGLYVEFDGHLDTGSIVPLTVALFDEARPVRLAAQALVLRVESRGTRCGAAVRLLTSSLAEMNQVQPVRSHADGKHSPGDGT